MLKLSKVLSDWGLFVQQALKTLVFYLGFSVFLSTVSLIGALVIISPMVCFCTSAFILFKIYVFGVSSAFFGVLNFSALLCIGAIPDIIHSRIQGLVLILASEVNNCSNKDMNDRHTRVFRLFFLAIHEALNPSKTDPWDWWFEQVEILSRHLLIFYGSKFYWKCRFWTALLYLYWLCKVGLKGLGIYLKLSFLCLTAFIFIPDFRGLFFRGYSFLLEMLGKIVAGRPAVSIIMLAELVLDHLLIWGLNFAVVLSDAELLISWYQSDRGLSKQNRRVVAKTTFAGIVQTMSIFIDSVGLPNYIRTSTLNFDRESVAQTYEIARDLGWPVNVKITEPVLGIAGGKFDAKWLLFGTDFRQGMGKRRLYIDETLNHLKGIYPEFKRSESFQNFDNELVATSRYFVEPDVAFPDISVDYVWPILKDIFQNSQLTSFNTIISKWEKKYALGAFFRDRLHPNRKFRRSHFITEVGGYAKFKQLWARTFTYSPAMVPVSAVFVKGEALPPKKWQNDKVRTVIGSPIFQYIMSTIWNFEPNHRFRWETTPIKVGMPLNGAVLSGLWQRHARLDHHFAGDMTNFDSTITAEVQRVIREVRKKGFENHKDFDRIASLIDLNYTLVENQLLNTTSTGNVYRKGSGLTTGHSSTSADNSITTVTLYLAAWKEITGYSALEFKHFNELSVYGDDHILSISSVSPPGWTWSNITKTMSRWNIEMRQEASGNLRSIPFLSKFGRKPTPSDREEFNKCNLPVPEWVIYHDKERLVGKLTSDVLSIDPRYRVKRLISYLDLCAHHPDVYMSIRTAIDLTMRKNPTSFKRFVANIPPYKKVVTNWYTKFSTPPKEPDVTEKVSEFENSGALATYGEQSFLDVLTSYLASVPDFLNPVVVMSGYTTFIQSRLAPFLDWPICLIAHQNRFLTEAQVASILPRTPYRFLTVRLGLPAQSVNFTTLLLRHWIFIIFHTKRAYLGVPALVSDFARKIGDVQFGFNAVIQQEVQHFDIPFWNMGLTAALHFVVVPDVLSFLQHVRFPNISTLWDHCLNYIYVNLWYHVPPNYRDLQMLKQNVGPEGPYLITAPTGTGKSTTMIGAITRILSTKYTKFILVEPRSLLVKTLVPYLVNTIGLSASGLTRGMVLDRRATIWVMTPQELLINSKYLDPDHLVILDEAHVEEEAYLLLRKVLRDWKIPTIYSTATPTDGLIDECVGHTALRMASFYVTTVREDSIKVAMRTLGDTYWEKISSYLRAAPPSAKFLVFVPDTKLGLKYMEKCPRRCCMLSSGKLDMDDDADVIFSTSVTDAGVTIPNVDYVISLDIDRRVGVLPNETNLSPFFIRLPDQTVKQRAGRTGRTNNGTFILVKVMFESEGGVVKDYSPTTIDRLQDWLSFGLTPKQLITYAPEMMLSIMGVRPGSGDYGTSGEMDRRALDSALELFGETLDSFVKNLSPSMAFRQFQEGLITNDGSNVAYIESNAIGHVTRGLPESLPSQLGDMIRGSAKIVSEAFPGLVFSDDKDIQERLWMYRNVITPFSKYFASSNFYSNDQPHANVEKSSKGFDAEEFFSLLADVWEENK